MFQNEDCLTTYQIEKYARHRTDKSFKMYIKASGEEHAQIVWEYWEKNKKKPEKQVTLRTVLRTK